LIPSLGISSQKAKSADAAGGGAVAVDTVGRAGPGVTTGLAVALGSAVDARLWGDAAATGSASVTGGAPAEVEQAVTRATLKKRPGSQRLPASPSSFPRLTAAFYATLP
jgi:hypothetical protein